MMPQFSKFPIYSKGMKMCTKVLLSPSHIKYSKSVELKPADNINYNIIILKFHDEREYKRLEI